MKKQKETHSERDPEEGLDLGVASALLVEVLLEQVYFVAQVLFAEVAALLRLCDGQIRTALHVPARTSHVTCSFVILLILK